jgi:hypothetical protein
MKKWIAVVLLLPFLCFGNPSATSPFDHDLHLSSIPGTSKRVMICCHGYGGNYKIAEYIKNLNVTDATLVSFNFPEHDIAERTDYDHNHASFGTMKELLPALYVVKQYVIDQNLKSIDLYGFSAGGGVVINLIAVLNTKTYDAELQQIGIGEREKTKMLQAIQKGVVILDAPLKSVEEIIALRGGTEEMEVIGKNYHTHGLRPIDSLNSLKGLALHIILCFQHKDEILSNRDDNLYIERLMQVNAHGRTSVIVADDGGHSGSHVSLWSLYKTLFKK